MKRFNEVIRIFHPVGQGAFYSERHENFNIVYDCGNFYNTKQASMVVKNSFNRGDEIDILFISHFDYDHVSGIEVLKREFTIKRVVLPLLHEDEKAFLVNIYRVLGEEDIELLIHSPEEFFGGQTKIIRVSSSDNVESPINGEPIDISKIDNQINREALTIQSGTVLHYNRWVYIPFNYECTTRKKELEKLFKKSGLDIKRISIDIGYAIKHRKKIREIYNNISGGINQNSLLLYSGPDIISANDYYGYSKIINMDFDIYCYGFPYYAKRPPANHRVGCIYTGDADLNTCNIKSIYKNYWDVIGTIQIPHHGSLKSFKADLFKRNHYICPISVGINNTFGHPSGQVIYEIIKNYCYPIMITETIDSILVERILY